MFMRGSAAAEYNVILCVGAIVKKIRLKKPDINFIVSGKLREHPFALFLGFAYPFPFLGSS